ncbi:TPA: hypothetical protein ACF33U_004183 [Vibrio parahaemolyticus]
MKLLQIQEPTPIDKELDLALDLCFTSCTSNPPLKTLCNDSEFIKWTNANGYNSILLTVPDSVTGAQESTSIDLQKEFNGEIDND